MNNRSDASRLPPPGAQAVALFIEERIKGTETVKDFATRAGVHNTMISQWKSGNVKTPDVDKLIQIADALRVDRAVLLQKAGILKEQSPDPQPLPKVTPEDALMFDERFNQQQKEAIIAVIRGMSKPE